MACLHFVLTYSKSPNLGRLYGEQMRTQRCLARRSLPALLAVLLVFAVLAAQPRQPVAGTVSAAQWRFVVGDLRAASAPLADMARLQFADGLQAEPEPSGPPLAAGVCDEYGRFVLLSARFGEVACVPTG